MKEFPFSEQIKNLKKLMDEGDFPISSGDLSLHMGEHRSTITKKSRKGIYPDGIKIGHTYYWVPSRILSHLKETFPTLFPKKRSKLEDDR